MALSSIGGLLMLDGGVHTCMHVLCMYAMHIHAHVYACVYMHFYFSLGGGRTGRGKESDWK